MLVRYQEARALECHLDAPEIVDALERRLLAGDKSLGMRAAGSRATCTRNSGFGCHRSVLDADSRAAARMAVTASPNRTDGLTRA